MSDIDAIKRITNTLLNQTPYPSNWKTLFFELSKLLMKINNPSRFNISASLQNTIFNCGYDDELKRRKILTELSIDPNRDLDYMFDHGYDLKEICNKMVKEKFFESDWKNNLFVIIDLLDSMEHPNGENITNLLNNIIYDTSEQSGYCNLGIILKGLSIDPFENFDYLFN